MTSLLIFIATGGFSGYLPKAPGTWGSLVGLALFLVLGRLDLSLYLAVVGGLLVAGFFAAGSAEKILDKKDPGAVVIDEIVGMLVTLTGAPMRWYSLVAGFLLFRFFDILKPFPVCWADRRCNGGIGIMLDDVLAGLYALGCLWLLRLLL